MDLVKSHLMMAVREEVELLRGYIRELHEKNKELERENQLLKNISSKNLDAIDSKIEQAMVSLAPWIMLTA
uniref:TSC22 domain family protein 3 n=1 Tax=Cynoglossus semilaevis TaxID=244447 RepID=A0A3P8VBF1_CYNSE